MRDQFDVDVAREHLRNGDIIFISRTISSTEREFLRADGSLVLYKEGSVAKDEDLLFARVPRNLAKSIVDGLTALGIKSADAEHVAGELVATKAHLADMRTLVFNTDKGDLPS